MAVPFAVPVDEMLAWTVLFEGPSTMGHFEVRAPNHVEAEQKAEWLLAPRERIVSVVLGGAR